MCKLIVELDEQARLASIVLDTVAQLFVHNLSSTFVAYCDTIIIRGDAKELPSNLLRSRSE